MTTLLVLTSAVRGMCGDPDTTEMPDATIQGVLAEGALDWMNRRKPGKSIDFGSLVTVADQQDYDVKPSNAYIVTDVWWMQSDFEWFSPSMRFLPDSQDVNFQLAGFSVIDNPALVEAMYKNIETNRQYFQGRGVETEEGKIQLMPTPGSAGDIVPFAYTYPLWAGPTNVPDRWLEGYKAKAAELVLRRLFIKRGRVRSTRTGSGGGGENEQAMADYYLEQAESKVPVPLAVFGRG